MIFECSGYHYEHGLEYLIASQDTKKIKIFMHIQFVNSFSSIKQN